MGQGNPLPLGGHGHHGHAARRGRRSPPARRPAGTPTMPVVVCVDSCVCVWRRPPPAGGGKAASPPPCQRLERRRAAAVMWLAPQRSMAAAAAGERGGDGEAAGLGRRPWRGVRQVRDLLHARCATRQRTLPSSRPFPSPLSPLPPPGRPLHSPCSYYSLPPLSLPHPRSRPSPLTSSPLSPPFPAPSSPRASGPHVRAAGPVNCSRGLRGGGLLAEPGWRAGPAGGCCSPGARPRRLRRIPSGKRTAGEANGRLICPGPLVAEPTKSRRPAASYRHRTAAPDCRRLSGPRPRDCPALAPNAPDDACGVAP